MDYCKTAELKRLIPWEEGLESLAAQSGVSLRTFCRIKSQETYETSEELADTILHGLGLVHLYYELDFKPKTRVHSHGVSGYKKGCRCNTCKSRHRDSTRRSVRKLELRRAQAQDRT